MLVSKISKKGQIVIPKEIRKKFDFHSGDVIIFKIHNQEIILEKIGSTMSEILKSGKPLKEDSTTFQRKLREEWSWKFV